MPEPQAIDAVDGGDSLDLVEPALGLDLGDDQVACVCRPHFGRRIARLVIVMGERERRTPPSLRWIMRRLGDGARLFGAIDHRHHDAVCADVERTGEEMIVTARHPHIGRDAKPPAVSSLGLEALDRKASVLHVVNDKVAARELQDLGDARCEKFEHHRAGQGLAGECALPQ